MSSQTLSWEKRARSNLFCRFTRSSAVGFPCCTIPVVEAVSPEWPLEMRRETPIVVSGTAYTPSLFAMARFIWMYVLLSAYLVASSLLISVHASDHFSFSARWAMLAS